MTWPIYLATAVCGLMLVAHLVVGARETYRLRPQSDGDLRRHWLQAAGAFQLVTVDLVALTALLGALALGYLETARRPLAWAIAAYLAAWTVAWTAVLATHKAHGRDWLALGQWIAFVLTAALMGFAAALG